MSVHSRRVPEPSSSPTGHSSLLIGWVLVGLMGLATLLSVLIFAHTSLRLDEAQSLFQISRDVPGVLYLVAQDVHVPLYHLLLKFWTILFGDDIATARYLSVVFFVATIPAVYYLGKLIFSRRVGLFAALLLAISPFMLWYGAEARMYALLAFLTVIHQILFVQIFKIGRGRYWVLYVVVAILGLYTHYFFGFVLLTEAIFYLFFRKHFPVRSLPKFIVAGVISVGSLVPWLGYVYKLGLASNTQPYLGIPSSGDIFNTYAQFLFGFQSDGLNTVIISLWPILVLAAFFTLQRKKQTSPGSVFVIMLAVLPVLGAFVVSVLIKPFFLSRYLIVSLPSLVLVFAWIISIYPPRVQRVVQLVVIILISGLLVIQIANPNTPVKEDYQQAVAYVSSQSKAQDVIIATAPFTIYPIEYYYHGPAKLTTQPIWDRFASGSVPGFDATQLATQTQTNVSDYRNAWLILSYDQGYNQAIKDYYDNHFQQLTHRQFSPGLTVYEYKIRYDPTVSIK